MLKTDTGNFNRFLTSLGLLLLAGALLIPYFYFHDTDVLRVSRKELNSLTPVGRHALEARQRRASDLEAWVLVLAGALVLGGAGSLYLGGRRLRFAQGKEDEAIDRQAKRDDVEIQRLSATEVEEKRDEQALEAAGEPPRPEPTGEAPARPPARAEPTFPSPPPTVQESRDAIARIEETLRRTFEGHKNELFEYIPEAKLVSGSRQLRIDGLFQSRDGKRPDVLLELKMNRSSRNLYPRARQIADTALALLTRYRALAGRRATTWVLIVIPAEEDEPPLDERRHQEDLLNSSLAGEGVGTVIPEHDLGRLPARFAELFDQA